MIKPQTIKFNFITAPVATSTLLLTSQDTSEILTELTIALVTNIHDCKTVKTDPWLMRMERRWLSSRQALRQNWQS